MKPVMLIILDGFGIGKEYEGNAVYLAKTPVIDSLKKNFPHSRLEASGLAVGLPEGQMGNSEVGHLNIGAGRVVYQDLTRISKSIEEGGFYKNEHFLKAIENCKQNDSSLHLMGLVSKGGVHSHMDHLIALVNLAKNNGLKKVYIHAILDGRDVPPNIGAEDLLELEEKLNEIGIGEIATVSGRYYAMDRDKRWDRTKLAYDNYTLGSGEKYNRVKDLIKSNYDKAIYDEFVIPGTIEKEGKPVALIEDNDSLIFFNFRPDRARQIVRALADENFDGFKREVFRNLYIVTMTQYDKTIPNIDVAYDETIPENTLGEVLANNNKKQLRIAETEKYAHVTFFFNGGREEPFEGEDRVLIPSPKVATYDLKPEMSAFEVTENVLERLEMKKYDCIILNFANPDMVGHTGSIPAAVKAIETVDECLGRILEKLEEVGGAAIITADHGNSETMLTDDNKPVTSHTTNLVPLYLVGVGDVKLREGKLSDLSPTILKLLDIDQPEEMTGKSLIKE
ncbi:2,3-bisphosphoglycerate-independent phosphoglycerate mutase [Anaerosphaera multitolerans]|uniref:2,3-bisphosphoglycerate-independent phosphoglycerate mutase n=1 Tax=Anaerosphaera multitolerans TaxID=2487351 RepID=A0A437S7T1_9FIRM|nr:2,3-bisphosphoglycerate-independent phosphoglycerate mutase [Anaerosphaera multitolerans]RVU55149.1 2,3-bisphosphoglycerate-independent phosphoglycerate mutase [Anaerosphaera multitolerans]